MLISFESLWAHLASTSLFAALVPIALGGTSYFTNWLVSEKELRERSDLRKQVLLERANKRLHTLFMQIDAITLKDLRGAAPADPDFIADFTEDLAQALVDIHKLAALYVSTRRSLTTFLVTAVLALTAILAALVFDSVRPFVALASYAIILMQVVLILLVRHWTTQFDRSEGRL